ncbi:MAG: FAD-dependent thymidylate synthase, partial [Candidatus Woesebacteria bacterium]|nr:FAD-dependent thymidylate synthase [Candidatus Woesebacteria bacterium]
RHRAGMGYSQESQRYVGGSVLRFVERPEFQDVPELHKQFEQRIDRVASEYENLTTRLLTLQGEGLKIVSAEQVTDKRKKVRQAARAALTNETEAIIVVTGNLRAWRHIFNMRVSEHAEVQIRKAIHKAYKCLKEVEPMSLGDFEEVQLDDGTVGLKTNYPKV